MNRPAPAHFTWGKAAAATARRRKRRRSRVYRDGMGRQCTLALAADKSGQGAYRDESAKARNRLSLTGTFRVPAPNHGAMR